MFTQIYLPQDRLQALAGGETLPDRTSGAVLFADISGFTPLTEALRTAFGARRGAEELTRHLNSVYTALIDAVEQHGGSVIGFAGDAITCWFDDALTTAAPRATACAFALQEAMHAFQAITLPDKSTFGLSLKVAVATGPARRFVVGNPEFHYMDTLAGATVGRTSSGEHLAERGEILLDETTVNALGDAISVKEWRRDEERGEQFAVARALLTAGVPLPIQPRVEVHSQITPEQYRPWLHPVVYERETSGQSSFLTEFRPCAVLFVRFIGIDYDAADAQAQLDAFIRQMQAVTSRYEGALLQLTIGDKGSYAYINFGALSAHEDDVRRAVKTALELRNQTHLQLQMGITYGVMRVGAYGGETRKTFGALGDDVNLAARLMQAAAAGEILLSGQAHKAVAGDFVSEPRPALALKGKANPVTAFALSEARRKRAVRLQEPNYSLPMVGRAAELKTIEDKLDLAAQSKGQIIGIVAEAGLGKSRLVAEVIRSARKKGFTGYGGTCQSDGIHTPYQPWKSIWQAFFDVDPEVPLRKQLRNIEGEIEDRAPDRIEAIPLLNVLLDLNIPENEFTQNLEPKIRQSALHVLLEDCLKHAAKEEPLLIVIEDLHWIDALSHDLLEQVAKTLANWRVCFVLAYRPPQMEHLQTPRLEALPQFTRIELHELTEAEAEQAIRAKLAQLYPARGGSLPGGLVKTLMARSQGNPFYLEELLNYVRDRGLDPNHLEQIELPDSLHALILSRIDQLSEQEKTTLRVASIVGRLFRARWLAGYYPEVGTLPTVKSVLEKLEYLEITPLDSPEPELAYLFKHIVTHEVTYESLPFATRARLHEQLARYLEYTYPEALPLEALAFHYGRSENKDKQREYLRKAGEAAQKNYANQAALDFFGELLPLLEDMSDRFEIYMQRGQVFQLMGHWDEAEADFQAALESGKQDPMQTASAQTTLGGLYTLRGEYKVAQEWLALAQAGHQASGNRAGLAKVFIQLGNLLYRMGEFVAAGKIETEALALSQEVGDQVGVASLYNNIAMTYLAQEDLGSTQAQFEKGLELFREIGVKWGMANTLNNLAGVAFQLGDLSTAQLRLEESMALNREVGNKRGLAIGLLNLADLATMRGDYHAAQEKYEESLVLSREVGDKQSLYDTVNNLGLVMLAQADTAAAQALFEESLKLRRELGDKPGLADTLCNLGMVNMINGDPRTARELFGESLALCKEMEISLTEAYASFGLGLAGLAEGLPEASGNILHSLRLHQETGEPLKQISGLTGAARLALYQGNPAFAAQLLGAIESALQALHAQLEPVVIHIHAQTLAEARHQLDEVAFQSAWEEGGGWSLEEAVKRALEKYE